MLEIKNLRKYFESGTEALKGVDLKVNKGEFVSILGPSGSGKTTLLRSINGLESIDNGDIFFNNKKIDKNYLPEVQKKTGMIFQEFNLINNLSAINNVLTGLLNSSNKFLSLFYIFTKDQKIKALRSLETVGLLEKSYNRSDELSGGQRQMLAISRALINDPDFLLLDEPTAALSPLYQQQIIERIDALRTKGITVLIVEQNARLSLSRSDRGYIFSNGKVVHTAPASEILVDPQINEYFLGTKKD